MSTRSIAVISASVVLAVLAGTAFVAFSSNSNDLASCSGSTVSGGAIGGPFELVREDGVTVTEKEVITKPTILYFGYTFCPDVCPLDSARNAMAQDLLLEKGIDVQTAFISIDPERDTPEVVADYTDLFHEDMIGLTGSLEQTTAASRAYKTYFKKQDGDPEYYLVDHSTHTYLVLPEIGFVEFFRRDDSPEKIAETVACFAKSTG